MRTRVKICGITRPQDALAAVQCGADAIGLVFYAPSPRAVTISQAAAVLAALPPFVTSVGLFVDAAEEEIRTVLSHLPLDVLQFHGDERPEDCQRYPRPYIKALRMQAGVDIAAQARRYAGACGILLDTYRAGVPGGTGEIFDWHKVPAELPQPLILAGGLNADNVAQAIGQVRPYAVDVSGGVEAQKGIKDTAKIKAFIHNVESGRNLSGWDSTGQNR